MGLLAAVATPHHRIRGQIVKVSLVDNPNRDVVLAGLGEFLPDSEIADALGLFGKILKFKRCVFLGKADEVAFVTFVRT